MPPSPPSASPPGPPSPGARAATDLACLPPPSAPYRADLDGVRALAVLAVVLFHVFPGLLPGGFAGVDVFFVISGYLITGIIVAALAAGRFSLPAFYRRRVHRLFPALVAVLACCLLGGWAWFTAEEYRELGRHTLWSALFSQNFALWSDSGYFDADASRKPLLHLWTLAIEEQFYLAYPLLLLVLWRCRLNLMVALVLLLLLSFAFNLAAIGAHPVAVFFNTASRAWELLAGGVVALAESARAPGAGLLGGVRGSTRTLLGAAGLALMLGALLCFDETMSYPGWRAAVPVLGTVLVIAAGPATAIHRALLGNRALAYIGLISYPLYLWHWPLLSFRAIVSPESASLWVGLALALSAMGLASATYHGLECRLRSRRTLWATLALAGAVILLAALGLLAGQGLLPPRLAANHDAALADQAAHDWDFPGTMSAVPLDGQTCYRAGGHGRTTLFWGDSHMQQYAPRISDLLAASPADGRGAVFLTGGSVPPLPGVEDPAQPAKCAGNEQRFRLLAAAPGVDTIVIAARWELYLGPASPYVLLQDGTTYALATRAGQERALAGLGALIAACIERGMTVYLVLDNPGSSTFQPHAIYRRGFLGGGITVNAQGITRSAALAALAPARDELIALAQGCGARLIDPLAALVRAGAVPALGADGGLIYMDSNHLRAAFVRSEVRYLDATVAP